MATYRADIKYIEGSDAGLIARNAAEFGRMHTLLGSVEESIDRACDINWESVAREHYEARVKDARSLIENLGYGFFRASCALGQYAAEVASARKHITAGIHASSDLHRILQELDPQLWENEDDPMRWYDAVRSQGRSTWNPLSSVLHLGTPMDPALLAEAGRYYRQADSEFFQAMSTEQRAREDCLAELRHAQAALPDFSGDFRASQNVVAEIESARAEFEEAWADANVHLPGAGLKDYTWPTDEDGAVSDKLAEINRLAGSHGWTALDYAATAGIPGQEALWIRDNKALIADAAMRSGIPPDMLAAILLTERDDGPNNFLVEEGRALDIVPGERDETSYGPMEIQIRRAADVLGYGPGSLTGDQRDEIRGALCDPVRSLYIAAEYMEQLKAGSEFADVPAGQMTDENYRQLAERYNGGPDYNSDDAKKYGGDFVGSLDDARKALQ
jgi:hypothetical protein